MEGSTWPKVNIFNLNKLLPYSPKLLYSLLLEKLYAKLIRDWVWRGKTITANASSKVEKGRQIQEVQQLKAENIYLKKLVGRLSIHDHAKKSLKETSKPC